MIRLLSGKISTYQVFLDAKNGLSKPESHLQLGAWLLSLGLSLLLGAQAVLSWRRWKIQNSHFFIRLEYLASIVLLIVLGK